MQRIIVLLSVLALAATSAFAQNRRSPQHIRAASCDSRIDRPGRIATATSKNIL